MSCNETALAWLRRLLHLTQAQVLECISEHHAKLRRNVRIHDDVTPQVLELIEMMLDPAEDRLQASAIVGIWKKSLQKMARRSERTAFPEAPAAVSPPASNVSQFSFLQPPPVPRRKTSTASVTSPTDLPQATSLRDGLACWPIRDAHGWRFDKKRSKSNVMVPDAGYCNQLKNRDHHFVLDDSLTMRYHWNDVKSVVALLADILFAEGIC